MTFTNQASLSYRRLTRLSNTTAGTLVPALSMTKSASVDAYAPDTRLTYQVTILNPTDTAYPALTILDDFGRYDWSGFGRFPVAYSDGTAALTLLDDGGARAAPLGLEVTFDGILFTLALPPRTAALLRYGAYITPYASPEAGASFTNTAAVQSGGPRLSLSAQNTLPAAAQADLRLSKAVAPGRITVGQAVTVTLTAANYGNTAADGAVISDLLRPYLTGLTVTAEGAAWTAGVQYDYDEQTGLFRTLPGGLTVPAAAFSRDRFGRWSVTPAAVTLTITGTAAAPAPPQPLMEVLPAYTDGREALLTAQRVRNDWYRLAARPGADPVFAVLSVPETRLTLLPGSDPRFTLRDGFLRADPAGPAGTATALLLAEHDGGRLTLRADFTAAGNRTGPRA